MIKPKDKQLFLNALEEFDASFALIEKESAKSAPKSSTKRLARRPKRSQISATLDLHGLKREEASRALAGFIADSARKGRLDVLIIHGKGSGALKEEVLDFLSKSSQIASFVKAPPVLGGDGAVVVRLKA